jgi:hypothetical protein
VTIRPGLPAAALLALAACGGPTPAPAPVPTPARPAPAAAATGAGIAESDLRLRLGIVAADSMLGREAGGPGNVKATAYIAAELARLGLEPAGENGSFFQEVPLVRKGPRPDGWLRAGGRELRPGADYAYLGGLGPVPIADHAEFTAAPAVYGGRLGDTVSVIPPDQAAGAVVVVGAPLGRDGRPAFGFDPRLLQRYRGAKAVAFAVLDVAPPELRAYLSQPQVTLREDPAEAEPPREGPLLLFTTAEAASALLGRPVEGALPGAPGQPVDARLGITESPTAFPARNVVAVLRGADPARRNTYVALGAHNDHVGTAEAPVDHDSLRAFNRVMRPQGAEDQPGQPTAEQAARIRALLDSLRRARPARLDSVYNGADDDGSGTVALLEVAEAMAAGPRPARSVLFVWHTAEEIGLFGALWYTDHPTVPRDSIIAALNSDMIGRGRAEDTRGGGPGYAQLIGSRRLSTQLGDLVEAVNREAGHGFTFDYQFDAPGHPQQYYCRSDHYAYARHGIPVTFFTTGAHTDYHQLTDEPEYIDYAKLRGMARLIHDIALRVANLDARPVVDGQVMGPEEECRQ